jgi:hypothetical protein
MAQFSFVSAAFARLVEGRVYRAAKPTTVVVGNGQLLSTQNVVDLTVFFSPSDEVTLTFSVFDSAPVEALIGVDYIARGALGIDVYATKQCITVQRLRDLEVPFVGSARLLPPLPVSMLLEGAEDLFAPADGGPSAPSSSSSSTVPGGSDRAPAASRPVRGLAAPPGQMQLKAAREAIMKMFDGTFRSVVEPSKRPARVPPVHVHLKRDMHFG